MPGIMIETRPIREYPYGEAVSSVTGYIGPNEPTADREEGEEDDYKPSEWIGRDGIEKSSKNYLRGRSGGIQMEVKQPRPFFEGAGRA